MTSISKNKNIKYGYARVSTEEQSLQLQLDSLNDYGVDIIVFEQDSGSRERPKLKELIASLQEGDTLVAWRLDRLCRSAAELLTLAEDLCQKGVHLVCIKENFDITTTTGRLIFGMLAVVAQFEREIIIQRTKAGIEAARRKGIHLGRPAVNKEKLDRAIQLYKRGELSVNEISAIVGIARSTLYKYFKDLKEKEDTNDNNQE